MLINEFDTKKIRFKFECVDSFIHNLLGVWDQ